MLSIYNYFSKPRNNHTKAFVFFLWFGTIWALRRAVSNSGERKRKEARHTPGMQRRKSVAQKEPRNTGGLKPIKGLFSLFQSLSSTDY